MLHLPEIVGKIRLVDVCKVGLRSRLQPIILSCFLQIGVESERYHFSISSQVQKTVAITLWTDKTIFTFFAVSTVHSLVWTCGSQFAEVDKTMLKLIRMAPKQRRKLYEVISRLHFLCEPSNRGSHCANRFLCLIFHERYDPSFNHGLKIPDFIPHNHK